MPHSHSIRIILSILVVVFAIYHYHPELLQRPKTPVPIIPTSTSTSHLSPEAYNVMFQSGTERPFSSPLDFETRKGTYVSADTGLPLFRSEDKYDSGTGWPSFVKPISTSSIILKEDNSLGESRTEVLTSDTHAHLGHVFDDGPPERGGKRYCMNGVALKFIPDSAPSNTQ